MSFLLLLLFSVLIMTQMLFSSRLFSILNFYFSVCSIMSKGVFAVFGKANSSMLATVKSYSNTFQIPYLTTSMAMNTTDQSPYMLFLRPINIRAIVDLIEHLGWRVVHYIYVSNEGK